MTSGASFEKKNYNYGNWTKGRFSEAVTVTGPGKMIFLAGIGPEHEETGEIMHPGNFPAQLQYAYKKLKELLEKNDATMADVVKQVSYYVDVRYAKEGVPIRVAAYGDAPLPAHTSLTVSALAWPGMLCEIDIIAMVPLK